MKNDKLGEPEKPKSHTQERANTPMTTQAFAGCPSNTPSHWCKKTALSCDWRFQFTSSLVFVSLLNFQEGCQIILTVMVTLLSSSERVWSEKSNVFPIPSNSIIHVSFSEEPEIVKANKWFSMLWEESASTLLFQDSKVSRGFLFAGTSQWFGWSRLHKKKGTMWISFMPLQIILFHTRISANTYVTGEKLLFTRYDNFNKYWNAALRSLFHPHNKLSI